MISKRNEINISSILIICVVSILFGYWFAVNQVNAVAPDMLATYPKMYLLQTISKCGLTIIIFSLFSQFIWGQISNGKLSNTFIAATYTILLLVYLHVALYWLVSTILVLQLLGCLTVLRKVDYDRLIANYLTDTLVFFTFFACHFFLTSRFSPLHWNMAMLVGEGYYTEEIPVLAPIFRGYLLAKQFSFSYVDPANWTGIMNPPITLSSTLMQILEFVLDLPSLSIESFHIVYVAIYFLMVVIGSFGFYLFLNYGAKLHKLVAFYGGFLYFFSGAPFMAQMFDADGGVLLSSFVVFPYALLLISLAFEKNNLLYALWAGAFLAAQFFMMTPHPEGVLYSAMFFGIFACWVALFTSDISLLRKFVLVAAATGSFMALSAYNCLPIIADRLSGNMYVFAHSGDVEHVRLHEIKLYMFTGVGAAMIFAFLRKLRSKRFLPVQVSCLLFSFSLLAILLLTTNTDFVRWLARVLHMGLHLSYPWRFGMYFYLSVFMMVAFAIEEMAEFACLLFAKFGKRLGMLAYEYK